MLAASVIQEQVQILPPSTNKESEMSTSVLECLQNAQCNFETVGKMGAKGNPIYLMAMEQLKNGIEALENGRDANYVIQEHAFAEVKT